MTFLKYSCYLILNSHKLYKIIKYHTNVLQFYIYNGNERYYVYTILNYN